ncbi:hypothetical protein H6S82_01415 [Planktothrix sp. FACHB-1355]|uniref:hypothetical protein n=1 Tax=Planktothrix sp. FACHB-1355 TaxID=2692854 RepID=UPI00168A4A2D|nr:hypothetical protein [Planktothrix sp. FACHB-1355]MBD3557526.1 hypothetical protein [Planktothrix sp. FACHB-1355]MBD3885884.1 hypothetical protein [Phormidium tenue FACHB-886]
MAKEKQKMTLNVKRRSTSIDQTEPPPAIDSSLVEAFASGAENAPKPRLVKTVEERVVRDAFTMPATDHEKFALIQKKCLEMGIVVTKSEIVRAGLNYFSDLGNQELKKIIESVPKLKTGRPTTKKIK